MTTLLTENEINTARTRARMKAKRIGTLGSGEAEKEKILPARGIMVGILIGSALWLVIGLVIYFTFF